MPRTILVILGLLLAFARPVVAAEPIIIGFGEAQTGGLAAIGRSGILTMQIWAERINAEGGLLGRPVKLLTYDTQSSPANVPGIYTKLLDIDHVDFVLSGYSTNMSAPAMPIVMAHHKLYLTLFSLAVNAQYHNPLVFAMTPTGPDPKVASSKGFFDIAAEMKPKPETLAIVGADAEFARNATDGARLNAKRIGLKIVYDQAYPPNTPDLSPVLRAVRAKNPDVIFIASYPTDSAGFLRAANEIGLKARLFGGSMVGLGTTSMKTAMGPLLNGVVLGEQWVPAPKLMYPGVADFLATYRERAKAAGVDPLGTFLPPFAYARMQVLEQAVKATGTLDDAKLGDYIRTHRFSTVVGEIQFGRDGEWSETRECWTQFQGVQSNDLSQFMDTRKEVVLLPAFARTGTLMEPYVAGQR